METNSKEVELKRGDKVRILSGGSGVVYEKATNSDWYYVKIGKNYEYINRQYLNKIE